MTSGRSPTFAKGVRARLHLDRKEMFITAAVLALSALIAFGVRDLGEVPSALIFVLGITIAGAVCGLASALLAALAGFLIYNFYLTEPALSFRIASGGDLAPLVVFNLCALVSGVLAGQLKDHAEAARTTNFQLKGLLALSQGLQLVTRAEQVIATVERDAECALGMRISLIRVDETAPSGSSVAGTGPELITFAQRLASCDPSESNEGLLLRRRLKGSNGSTTLLVAEARESCRLDPAFFEALGNLVALALERAALSEKITEAMASARAEELKTALLASVSHDFRTPLTAISASASSLIAYGDRFDAATSERLLQGIVDECERLNRYTANLLEMSRMEAGGAPEPLQLLAAGEMASTALQRVRPRAGSRSISLRSVDPELLVLANPALFELVLINILDNAIIYSDDAASVVVTLVAEDGACRIDIADSGYGIPEEALRQVFDRFFRAGRSDTTGRGSGLGLTIAKGFVEALGGTIEARLPGLNGRGTCITIRLPLVAAEET